MNFRRKIAAYCLALLSLVGALTLATAPAALADINTCDLSKRVDELRAWDTNGAYNIIVWKESAQGGIRLNGVALQGTHWAETCGDPTSKRANYFWAMFRDGEFTLKGDGGYRNWAFYGRWNRNDRHVTFLPR